MSYENFNLFAVIVFVSMSVLGFLQSYINLKKKKYSHFFIDAVMLFVLGVIKGRKIAHKEESNNKRINQIGWMTFMGSLLSLYYAVDWYLRYIK